MPEAEYIISVKDADTGEIHRSAGSRSVILNDYECAIRSDCYTSVIVFKNGVVIRLYYDGQETICRE